MKRNSIILTMAFSALCTTAVAQTERSVSIEQMNAASRARQQQMQQQQQLTSTAVFGQSDNTFSTLYLQYNPTTYRVSNGGKNKNYGGVSVGYSYTTPIAGDLLVEAGAKAQFFFRSESSKNNGDRKVNLMSLTAPINLAYSFTAGNSLHIDPYAGLFARLNIWGESRYKGQTINLFSKDDMIDPLERFNYGFQAGIKARINDFIVFGAVYWMDFNEIEEHTKLSGFDLTFGLTL